MSAGGLAQAFAVVRDWIEGSSRPAPEPGDLGAFDLRLRPPASEASIAMFERTIGRAVPPELRELMRLADGQDEDFVEQDLTWLPSARLLSVEAIERSWADARPWDRELETEELQDVERIRRLVRHPAWIPIAGDAEADLFLDLAPGPKGTVGQLISFVSESELKVIAPSLGAFFETYAGLIEEGALIIRKGAYGWSVAPAEPVGRFDTMRRLFREALT